ncbi:MAG: blue (type 1) copper domain protein [Candidatus Saccharibacteria bacterium]|nr:blue (type 1) copper domain protein [Candidatus Saccharibacteria bacterium]
MKNNKGLFVGIAAAAIILIAAYAIMANSGNDKMNMGSTSKPESSGSTATDTGSAVEASTVTIQNYKFEAPIIKVKAGTTVTWTNKDDVSHNVAPDGASDLPVGKLIAKGETYSYTFNKAGTYNYLCEPHPYMKGTVVVTE